MAGRAAALRRRQPQPQPQRLEVVVVEEVGCFRKVVVKVVVVSMLLCMRRLVHSYPQAAAVGIH